jgi:hypothetical protein
MKMNWDDQRNAVAALSPENEVRFGGCVGPKAGVSFFAVRESVLTQYAVILVLTFINDFTDIGLPIRTADMREEKVFIPSKRVNRIE